MLRSCYTTMMQFDEAGQIVVPVRWYFCAPGAKTLPNGTLFYSKNWDTASAGWPPGPGEVWGDRTYSKGQRPTPLRGNGNYCGPDSWYTDGCPSSAPPLQLVGGIPACCPSVPPPGQLGLMIGPAQVPPCPQLPYPNPAYALINGIWVLATNNFQPFYQWHIAPPDPTWQVSFVSVEAQNTPQKCITSIWYVGPTPTSAIRVIATSMMTISQQAKEYQFNFPTVYPGFGPVHWIVRFTLPPGQGALGLALGLRSRGPHLTGRVGLKLGLASQMRPHLVGQLGLKLGLSGPLVPHLVGELGLKLGTSGPLVPMVPGALGLKLGLSSVVRPHVKGVVGVKLGIASKLRGKLPGSVGVKLGLASSLTAGQIVACCPGVVIPNTLTVTNSAGHTATATFTSANGGWTWTDPDGTGTWTLKCVNTGSAFQWQTPRNIFPHCTNVYTVPSLVCHPFALTTQVVTSGVQCLEAGTFRFSFHP